MILMSFGRFTALLASSALLMVGCSPSPSTQPEVVTSFYALQYAAEQVLGDPELVTNLTTPGMDPHDLELSPRQVASMSTAGLVVHLEGFQPSVDESILNSEAQNVLDISEAADLHVDASGDFDPHFWLDPMRLADVADRIADELISSGHDDEQQLRDNAADLRARMEAITDEWSKVLEQCERRDFITTHSAFGYLAEAFDLTQIGIMGFSPNEDPSPARIAEINDLARDHGITTIFYEPLDSDALSRTIASDLGLTSASLDPIESPGPEGEDYPALMDQNLKALRSANDCS